MAILVDSEIIDALERASPLVESTDADAPIDKDIQIQPSSLDLRLSRFYRRFKKVDFIDVLREEEYLVEQQEVKKDEPIVIRPNEVILSSTVEKINLTDEICARIATRQSLARYGITTHLAQYMNPGYEGIVPLQLINHGPTPVILRPYLRIGTIVFEKLTKKCSVPYGTREDKKYQYEERPEPSRLVLNGEFKKSLTLLKEEMIKSILKDLQEDDALEVLEDSVKMLISEAVYLAKSNGREVPTKEDIEKAGKHISLIYNHIRGI